MYLLAQPVAHDFVEAIHWGLRFDLFGKSRYNINCVLTWAASSIRQSN